MSESKLGLPEALLGAAVVGGAAYLITSSNAAEAKREESARQDREAAARRQELELAKLQAAGQGKKDEDPLGAIVGGIVRLGGKFLGL